MTVKEIIENFLVANGYDGLYNEDVDCACKLDDLMPCGYSSPECKAGYLIQVEEDGSFFIGKCKKEI